MKGPTDLVNPYVWLTVFCIVFILCVVAVLVVSLKEKDDMYYPLNPEEDAFDTGSFTDAFRVIAVILIVFIFMFLVF